MSKTFEQGRDEIATLCKYFATNTAAFVAPGVKEAHIRQNLIDPLFEALGWDVRNGKTASTLKASKGLRTTHSESARFPSSMRKPRSAASTFKLIRPPLISFAGMAGAPKLRCRS
jgi:hypothetical protein